MIVLACDPGLSGAAALLDTRGELIDVFDLPVIGEGTQRRIDGANFCRSRPRAYALRLRHR
jgi:hypothetical protein